MCKLIFLIGSFFLIIPPLMADNIQCIGMDNQGRAINVIFDPTTLTLNVNGDILKLTGVTQGRNGLTTKPFLSNNGTVIYDSIAVDAEKSITLYQFNAVTQAFIDQVHLACH